LVNLIVFSLLSKLNHLKVKLIFLFKKLDIIGWSYKNIQITTPKPYKIIMIPVIKVQNPSI